MIYYYLGQINKYKFGGGERHNPPTSYKLSVIPLVCIIWIIYRPSALLCIINITYNRITLKIHEIHQAISEL